MATSGDDAAKLLAYVSQSHQDFWQRYYPGDESLSALRLESTKEADADAEGEVQPLRNTILLLGRTIAPFHLLTSRQHSQSPACMRFLLF